MAGLQQDQLLFEGRSSNQLLDGCLLFSAKRILAEKRLSFHAYRVAGGRELETAEIKC